MQSRNGVEHFCFAFFSVRCSSVLPELMSDASVPPGEQERHVFYKITDSQKLSIPPSLRVKLR
jgi:hypothetical protein